ncbi:WD repeat-containing protein 76 isoform X1 [Nematostella vectensis]|uniref:WD repeat-containing protein 76 isoform X1 n=1 Tax=Nematostella vectensis TaxID=45351 RepID=UPI00207756BE|nr:WD repeat-containing protein 76 isoform X1 [Nematostella vectensis]
MPKGRAAQSKKPTVKIESEPEYTSDEDVTPHIGHSASQLSEYEKRRLENIRKNNEMLAKLNIDVVKQELVSSATKKRKLNNLSIKKTQSSVELPRRKSLRIRRITPDGMALPEPPPTPVYPEPSRLPSGPLDMDPINEVEDIEAKGFLCKMNQLSCKVKKTPVKSSSKELKSLSLHEKSLRKLQVKEDHVHKVVSKRIVSILFHPAQTKVVVLASDKSGKLGMWDVGSSSSTEGVYLFEPHSNVIPSLAFDPDDTTKLYSCSYDGTLRCADLTVPVFHEVLSLDEDDTAFSYMTFGTTSHSCLLASCFDGSIMIVDSRIDAKKRNPAQTLDVHDRAIKCVDVHPTNRNLVCTSTRNGAIAFWDVRNFKNRKSILSSLQLGRSVSSAFFSPITGQQIVATCMNDTVTVHDVSDSGIATHRPKCLFRHDNGTGRWLTTFNAVWDPKHDDLIAVGSMSRNRQIDVYSSDYPNSQLLSLQHENMTTINSRLAFHPSLNMLVGGNSSGKVYLWTE